MPSRNNSNRIRQAINNYNRAVENHNRQVSAANRRALDDYNRKIRELNTANRRAVDNYNREVREHNARVRSNQQRLRNEIMRLNARRTTTVRHVRYQTSVQVLYRSFERIEESSEQGTWTGGDELFEMAEGEVANSVAVLNAIEDPSTAVADGSPLRQTMITSELREISPDLDGRWQGALFALDPANPDAARHFCTSSRELFVRILDLKAPDKEVLAAVPNAELTEQNQVTRREKIRYCLSRTGQMDPRLVQFVDDDINNVLDLFREFNSATHGEAGKFDFVRLGAIKKRVEGAITFLHRIVSW